MSKKIEKGEEMMVQRNNTIRENNKGVVMGDIKNKDVKRETRASVFDLFEDDIRNYVAVGLSSGAIQKLINAQLRNQGIREVSVRATRYYIDSRIRGKV